MGDYIFQLINWILQGLVNLLPTDFTILKFSTYQGWLTTFEDTIVPIFNWINNIFPIDILLLLIVATFLIELAIIGLKAGQYLINLVRGAGA